MTPAARINRESLLSLRNVATDGATFDGSEQMATTPPEVLFHRRFQRLRRQEDRELYRGKADLDRLPGEPLPVKLLEDLQTMLNAALAGEKDVPEHADHEPFHFDYVDSDEPNALALCGDGHSFIGVTIPLLDRLWQSASRVADSADVATLLNMQLSEAERTSMNVQQRIAVGVFRLELLFIVLHEWTHVVHGHVRPDDAGFANEVLARNDGNIEQQARESDADGYAAYHMLENIINGPERAHVVSVLAMGDKTVDVQEKLLLCCFIIAVAAYLFTCEPQEVNSETAYTFQHPPQALRMNLLMKSVKTWCYQNRQTLHEWLTLQPFQRLMNLVATATWGMNGGDDWSEQIRFLKSPDGMAYAERVEVALIEQIKQGYRN